MSDRRTPLAKARDEFLESDAGKKLTDASTLGNTSPDYYLRNRLERAFMAGVAAQRALAQSPTSKQPGMATDGSQRGTEARSTESEAGPPTSKGDA